ncbi:MAG: serine--tRNA ligase [Deltaproteobacteria bacterium]|nr:serine--tRNA ligase [Deltaproteobacteria bacterium]MBN2672166.1 serine--tRNA ligase [Deltaproteobacteria bacterium]
MLDIQRIRQETDAVKKGLELAGTNSAIVDQILELDLKRRTLQQKGDDMRAQLNVSSKNIGRENDPNKRQELIAAVSSLKGDLKALGNEVPEVEQELERLMLTVPNIPLAEVPVGDGESGNTEKEVFGDLPEFDFTPKPHWELMENLGIIDFERGQKISGSRFYVLRGQGAKLQRALISWMLDVHTEQHGYQELYPPVMVREECLFGTGNLPKFGENLYRDIEGDHWFVPTAEVPVTNFYRNEILSVHSLPIKHVAYTPCFRREKMSHGKDTRGIKRGHQFDKVELVRFEHPDASRAALEQLTEDARKLLSLLGLRHRILTIGAGDLSFVACFKYDLETWAAGTNEWLEVSSCSLFQDFQARRAKIRFKDNDGKNRYVHTLNGSGLALPRVVISIIEQYQQADGTVIIPEVLRPYMGGKERITKQ